MLWWLFVEQALAWGPTGHRAVAHIAQQHIGRKTQRRLSVLMGTESLVRASTWPDEIRSDPQWSQRLPTAHRWHYINAPPGQPIAPTDDPDNLLSAIEHWSAVAADTDADADLRRQAVRWLVHLVGDAHQPLHAGHAEDRGGNDVAVTFFGEDTNLHRVMDEHLIDHARWSYTELALAVDVATPEDIQRLQRAQPLDWLMESRALLPEIYAIEDGALSWGYVYRTQPLVERRIAEAGIRLAGLLDAVLG